MEWKLFKLLWDRIEWRRRMEWERFTGLENYQCKVHGTLFSLVDEPCWQCWHELIEELEEYDEHFDCPVHGRQNGPDCPRC